MKLPRIRDILIFAFGGVWSIAAVQIIYRLHQRKKAKDTIRKIEDYLRHPSNRDWD